MTQIRKCDLCENEVPAFVGQMALGALEGKPQVLDVCPECRQKVMDLFNLKDKAQEEANE